jgi:hypothetical protein
MASKVAASATLTTIASVGCESWSFRTAQNPTPGHAHFGRPERRPVVEAGQPGVALDAPAGAPAFLRRTEVSAVGNQHGDLRNVEGRLRMCRRGEQEQPEDEGDFHR